MSDFHIERDARPQGGGYVFFTARDDDGNKIAAGAFWPRTGSGKLWTAEAYRRERTGEGAALSQGIYNIASEHEMRHLVEAEARKALCN